MTTAVIPKAYYIDEIRFDGDTQLTNSELEAIAEDLKPGNWIAEDGAVQRTAENARKEWANHGYLRAEITATTEQLGHDPTSEHVAVILHVNAGRQYKTGEIKLITSDGRPPVFPSDELRQLIPLPRGDIFETSKWRKGIDNLSKHYGEIGYINFGYDATFDFNDKTSDINVTLRLDQETQYRVESVTIEGLDPEVESELRSLMPIGELYNSTKVREFLRENPDLPHPISTYVSWNDRSDQVVVTIRFKGCAE
jgi:outer membrane protein assembly factor BamA